VISFRYHLVTIVAVFLALGLGVVVGTTVIDQGLVDRLEAQTQDANANAARARERADQLEGALERERGLAEDYVARSTADRLIDDTFVILTDDTTDGPTLEKVVGDLEEAGGRIQAVVSTTPRLALDDRGARSDVAALLDLPTDSPRDRLQATAGQGLGERLARGVRGQSDVLYDLLEAGFLAGGAGPGLRRTEGDSLPDVGGPGQNLIVVSGGGPDPLLPPDRFLEPAVLEASVSGSQVAAVEPADAVLSLATSVRGSASQELLTVDNVDETPGTLSLVLGLEDLIGAGQGGNYGFKQGADAPYPPLGT